MQSALHCTATLGNVFHLPCHLWGSIYQLVPFPVRQADSARTKPSVGLALESLLLQQPRACAASLSHED